MFLAHCSPNVDPFLQLVVQISVVNALHHGEALNSPSWYLLLTAYTGTTPTQPFSFYILGFNPTLANCHACNCSNYFAALLCWYTWVVLWPRKSPFSSRNQMSSPSLPLPWLLFTFCGPEPAWSLPHDRTHHRNCGCFFPEVLKSSLDGQIKGSRHQVLAMHRGLDPDSALALTRSCWTQWELICKMTG